MRDVNEGHAKRVILVDDDSDDRELFAEAVSFVNPLIAVELKRDGEELMNYLADVDAAPDVIFLDLNMPRKNGKECLSEIRAQPRFLDTRIVIYTTSLNPLDVDETFNQGAFRFVRKPSSFEGLKEMLDKLLSNDLFNATVRTRENFVVTGNL